MRPASPCRNGGPQRMSPSSSFAAAAIAACRAERSKYLGSSSTSDPNKGITALRIVKSRTPWLAKYLILHKSKPFVGFPKRCGRKRAQNDANNPEKPDRVRLANRRRKIL